MKTLFIEKSINIIKKNRNYSDIELEKISYGLEGIYLLISKFLILISVSIVLGITKEFLIFTILYNFIRMPAFGIHASKSYICLLSSFIIFLLVPYLAKTTTSNNFVNLILCLFSLLLIFLYAPADTHKRPLINKKKRFVFKITSLFIGSLYFVLSILVKNNFISNALVFSLVTEVIMILPITYKIFKMPYKNYKRYSK